MLKEVQKILGEIEDILLRTDQAGTDLWAILTALRGPDGKVSLLTDKLKMATTARVRGAAFPRLLAQSNQLGYNSRYCGIQGGEPEVVDPSSYTRPGHFESHICEAVKAIHHQDTER